MIINHCSVNNLGKFNLLLAKNLKIRSGLDIIQEIIGPKNFYSLIKPRSNTSKEIGKINSELLFTKNIVSLDNL